MTDTVRFGDIHSGIYPYIEIPMTKKRFIEIKKYLDSTGGYWTYSPVGTQVGHYRIWLRCGFTEEDAAYIRIKFS